MNPVQSRHLVALEEPGRRHVRQDHALLDQTMRVIALGGQNPLDLAICAVFDDGFLGVEIHRPAFFPARPQQLIQLVQPIQMRDQRSVFRPDLRVAVSDDGRRRLIGQPGVRAHHRLDEA